MWWGVDYSIRDHPSRVLLDRIEYIVGMKRILTTSLLLLCAIATYSQALPIVWEKSFGGSGNNDEGYTIVPALSGYLLVGVANSGDGLVTGNYHGGNDMWGVKVDENGNVEWDVCFGNTQWQSGLSGVQTSDGGYIIVGASGNAGGDVSSTNGGSDFWVVKIGATGTLMWEQTYGTTSNDAAHDVIELSTGNLIVVGQITGSGGDLIGANYGGEDLWMIHISSTGILLNQALFGGIHDEGDYLADVVNLSQDRFAVVTSTNSIDGNTPSGGIEIVNDIWLIVTNSSFIPEISKRFGGTNHDNAQGVAAASDGGYLIVGSSRSDDGDVSGHHGSTGVYDIWAMKADSLGNLVWQNSLGCNLYDEGHGIAELYTGHVAVAGYVQNASGDVTNYYGGNYDVWLAFIDTTGALVRQWNYGGSDHDYVTRTIEGNDGSIMVIGRSSSDDHDVSTNYGGFDMWVFKLDNILGMDEHNLNTMSLFPNPSVRFVEISTSQYIESLHLYSIDGKFLQAFVVEGFTANIDLGSIEAGTYLLVDPQTGSSTRLVKL